MIELNLVPDVKQQLIAAQRIRNTVSSIAVLVGAGALAILILLGLFVLVAQPLLKSNLEKSIDKQYAQLSSVEDLSKLLTIQNQLNSIATLDDQKLITSRMINLLEIITHGDKVKLNSVIIGSDDLDSGVESEAASGIPVRIEGSTRDSYAALEVLQKMLLAMVVQYESTNPEVASNFEKCASDSLKCSYLVLGAGESSDAVQIAEMNYGEDQTGEKALSFSLSFMLTPEFLASQSSSVEIKISRSGNVTDSYLGLPQTIFIEQDQPAKTEEED